VTDPGWREEDSAVFLELGHVATPWRGELTGAFLALIPAEPDEPFLAVDLAAGSGWLSEAVLERFPRARVLVVDGSPTMLEDAAGRLVRHAGRFEKRLARLDEVGWLPALGEPPRVVMSCLAIHHLDGAAKRRLYERLYERLPPGGALLVADVVAHTSEPARRYWARLWEEDVRRVGSGAAIERFVRDGWNYFDHPDDPIDRPSPLAEQLAWLGEIGFVGVDAFWVKAGHALFGGYKGTASSRL
jgi:tRNA (cmo5U34)-methyltransferase